MLIWDYIRDFLVQYIFGGHDSVGDAFACHIGCNADADVLTTESIYVKMPFLDTTEGYDFTQLSIGDWLSTTTTIIIMCLIVVLFAMLVRWVFKTVVSAFLLR